MGVAVVSLVHSASGRVRAKSRRRADEGTFFELNLRCINPSGLDFEPRLFWCASPFTLMLCTLINTRQWCD
jgi:hypothetical protein